MDIQKEDDEEQLQVDPLHLMLESCASITKKALACRTLGSSQSICQGDPSSMCRREEELQKWLDQQIIDYRVAIAQIKGATINTDDPSMERKRSREGTDEPQSQTKRIHLLEEKLFDETLRLEQARRLVTRIQMSRVAQETILEQQQDNEAERSKKYLCQEAVKSRDEQVGLALKKLERMDVLDKEMLTVAEKSREVRKKNRDLWDNRLGQKKTSEGTLPSADTLQKDKTERLKSENLVLKRALLDLIVGSGIDWFSDERIRDTMMKLED